MALSTMYEGKNNSPQTDITSAISAADQIIPVTDISVFPAAPNLATLGNDENAEVIRYNGIEGSTLTGCERGFGGTTAAAWSASTVISRQITKYDLDTLRGNVLDLESRKQNNLTFDTTPTAGSSNPVTSDGIKTALDLKANLASPALTGTPTAPTAGVGTNNTQLATTAFVVSHDVFKITGTVSASNYTLTDNRINNEHWEVDTIYFETPSNVTSKVHWTTNITTHQVSLSATYAGSTNVVVKMHWVQ